MNNLVKTIFVCLSIVLVIAGAVLIFPSNVLSVNVEADAGDDIEITEGYLVKLKGVGKGEEIKYFWSCNGGLLSNAHISQPNFTAPMVKQDTEYICI